MIRTTIRQLEYFAALAQTLHFGRAAQQVGVTQPALSAQIAELEERLSCRLFDRGRRSVALTEEGALLLPRVESVLRDVRGMEAAGQRDNAAMTGRLRLGIIPTVAPYLLPRLLPHIGATFPGLRLEFKESVTATLLEEVHSGRLDAALVALPVEDGRFETQMLLTDRFHLAVPQDDQDFIAPPVAPESPELERLLLLEEGHCLRDQALAICGAIRPKAMANFGATSLTTLLQMVAHGQGLTLIPDMALASSAALPGVKIVPFQEPVPTRTIGMAWRRNGSREADCRALADAIADDSGVD